jgi:hypothetical protein
VILEIDGLCLLQVDQSNLMPSKVMGPEGQTIGGADMAALRRQRSSADVRNSRQTVEALGIPLYLNVMMALFDDDWGWLRPAIHLIERNWSWSLA